MKELYIDFQINGEKYIMVIQNRLFKPKRVALYRMPGQKLGGCLMGDILTIDRIRTNTLKNVIEYWSIITKLKLTKHRRKQNCKSVCSKS